MNAHRARKRFGQNFLHDPGIISRIVSAVDPRPGEAIVEIGPGRGAITRPLLERAGSLHAVELDRDLVEPLRALCADSGDLVIHQMDALLLEPCRMFDRTDIRLVGNLPYNISTPLMFHLLESSECIRDMHFMLQKEVVDRLVAEPGNKAYGRLSVMVRYHCRATRLFTIGPGAFQPAPRVDSAFVRLVPHRTPPVELVDEKCFAQLVARAFSQRRKTLRNSLRDMLDDATMRHLGIDPGLRPEQLSLDGFALLANASRAKSG